MEDEEQVLPQDMAGPPVWSLIHYTAKTGLLAHGEAQLFMHCLVSFFPCPHCRAHGLAHLSENPVTLPFFDWTVEYHNAVNRRAGKKLWTLHQAEKEYTERRLDASRFGKALKVLLYNLENDKNAIKEVQVRRERRHQDLQMFVSLLEKAWPMAEERRFFQSLSISQSNAAAYLYSVLRTVPSIQSEFPKRQGGGFKAEFVAEAQQLLRASSTSGASIVSSSSSSSSSSASSRRASSQTVMVWIIVFISLFLVFYFVLMMQRQ